MANVVVEATGAAISSATLLGYQAEGARTNTILQSQTLGTTWTVSGATITADQYTAPDGTTTSDKLLASIGLSTHYVIQGAVATSAVASTYSAYVKYINNQWISLSFNEGTNNITAAFDVLNGVVGTKSGAASASTITSLGGGVYRISVTGTTVAGTANCAVVLQNSDTGVVGTWTALGTEALGIWGVQVEAGSFASSYIPTTTVAVTRNSDNLNYVIASNFNNTVGTAYAEVTNLGIANTLACVIGGDTGGVGGAALRIANTINVGIEDGTTVVTTNGSSLSFLTAVRKIASAWGGATMSVSKDGAAAATGAFDGNMNMPTSLYVGRYELYYYLSGNVRNLSIWATKKTDAELAALTA